MRVNSNQTIQKNLKYFRTIADIECSDDLAVERVGASDCFKIDCNFILGDGNERLYSIHLVQIIINLNEKLFIMKRDF